MVKYLVLRAIKVAALGLQSRFESRGKAIFVVGTRTSRTGVQLPAIKADLAVVLVLDGLLFALGGLRKTGVLAGHGLDRFCSLSARYPAWN